jgi:site-specific DNA-methyltransferase (adenine-specific)
MAGFEIRDSIGWVYGSGFPKSLDVSKAIDKAAGAEREVIEIIKKNHFSGDNYSTNEGWSRPSHRNPDGTAKTTMNITAPSTDEAKQWQGWGTALKPALEPIVVARKPLIGTVAENVLTHGTGGLNIDASRISGLTEKEMNWTPQRQHSDNPIQMGGAKTGDVISMYKLGGRWPANLILDEYTAELLDEQSGSSKSPKPYAAKGYKETSMFGVGGVNHAKEFGDSGGASRFFYVAKASKRDRNEGLEDMPLRKSDQRSDKAAGIWAEMEAPKQNFHPTVKPTDLMRYLVKLITPPGGTVLDPFTGSGSTGKAAILEGFDFIGIELTEDYWPIIEGRLKHAEAKVAEAKEKIEAQPQGLF